MSNTFFDSYLFLIFLIGICSVLFLISVKNPIYSILFFILIILNFSFILFLLGFDFLGLILIIVYIGAIAVLFLFLVMMLNIKLLELRVNYWFFLPIGFLIVSVFFYEVTLLLPEFTLYDHFLSFNYFYNNWLHIIQLSANLQSIGFSFYSYFIVFFIFASLILLLALIGSIILTLHQNLNVKRQQIFFQREKSIKDSLVFYK